MTMRVTGPRTQRFINLLSDYCGMTLTVNGSDVEVDSNTLLDPFESITLQNLVSEIIDSGNLVEIHAFGGKPAVGFFVDSFFANPGVQRPRRSVYVDDLLHVEKLSPTLARSLMGHVLREYFGASRPAGQTPSNNFGPNHIAGIRTEAEVAGDLESKPVFTGNTRPWEGMFGHTNVRHYGPTMKFQLFFSAGWDLVSVRGP